MQKIKTKFGDLYMKEMSSNEYALLDSQERVMFYFDSKKKLYKNVQFMEICKSIKDWLEKYFYDVCWGMSKQDIIDIAKDYHERNDRVFDIDYLEEHYNKIGDTYILFGYSDCYKEGE